MLFEAPQLDEKELGVLDEVDRLREVLRGQVAVRRRWVGSLRRLTFARNVQGCKSMQETTSLDDVAALLAGERSPDSPTKTEKALHGYRAAMGYVHQLSDDPHFRFDETLIRSLHFMMLSYDLRQNPGRWRPGLIFVRYEASADVVYESPDADRLPGLMSEFVESIATRATGQPLVVRAAMAHLNLVLIHPFRDGNGRMARCIQALMLSRDVILAPEFASIEEYLGRNTPSYYAVLAEVGAGGWHPERDARPWVRFCLTAHLRQAQTLLRRVREAEELWDRCERMADAAAVPSRTVAALSTAAQGHRIWRQRYQTLDEPSLTETIATRDLRALVQANLLVAHGEKRGRTYSGGPQLRETWSDIRSRRKSIDDEDPFG